MKLVRVVPAIAALALTTASLMAPAASATDQPPGEKPEVIYEHFQETEEFGKKEMCKFPVSIESDVRTKYVITNGGDDVYQESRGKVRVTNLDNGRSIRLRIDNHAYVKVSEDGDQLRVKGFGDEVLYNDDIVVKGHHRTYSDANRGHQEDEGIYYFDDATAKVQVTGLNSENGEDVQIRAYLLEGEVVDVCKELAGRDKDKRH